MFSNNTFCSSIFGLVQEAYDFTHGSQLLNSSVQQFQNPTLLYTKKPAYTSYVHSNRNNRCIDTSWSHFPKCDPYIYTCTLEGDEDEEETKSMGALKYGFLVHVLLGAQLTLYGHFIMLNTSSSA